MSPMGIWQKTMFYLGLVDEDSVGYEATPQARQPERRPPARPTAEVRRAAEPRQQVVQPQRGPLRARPPEPTAPPAESSTVRVEGAGGYRHAESMFEDPTELRGEHEGVAGRRVEPPLTARRRPVADRALSDAGVTMQPGERPLVRTVSSSELESQVIVARSYNDAQVLADHIRANIPVVLDLRKVEPAMVRRLVDFSSGLTYALGGSMRKIGQGVVLVTPSSVNLSRDERRRLKDLGYYQAPEEA